MVSCAWDEKAVSSRWEGFLLEVCPEDGAALEMAYGLSLTYNRQYHVILVFHGKAASGKSTALGVLELLNQGATSHVPLSAFGDRLLHRNRRTIFQQAADGAVESAEKNAKPNHAGNEGRI